MSTTIGPETVALIVEARKAVEALEDHPKAAWEDAVDDYDPADGLHTLYSQAVEARSALFAVLTGLARLMGPAPTVDW